MNVSPRVFPLALICCLLLGAARSSYCHAQRQDSEHERISQPDRDHPTQRDAWFSHGRTAPPGVSAALLRYRAYQQKLETRRLRANLGANPENAGTASWAPLGPAPIVSAAFAGSPQDYGFVSGRATAVAIDAADTTGNTVYVGGAHGGIWKSVNAASPTASQVVWAPVADFAPTLAVGSIAIQPGNSNPNTSVVLVGTGEPNNSADSYYGLGILRSANGGATWSLIQGDSTGQYSFAGLGFSKIAFSTTNPQLVVAAAATAYTGELEGLANENNRGVYVSTDAGQTWNYASIQDAGTTITAASVTSVIFHPAAGKFFAAIRFHGIYSSSDGVHWSRLADANQPGSNLSSSLCPPASAATCLFYRAELSVPVVPLGSQPRNELYSWVVDVDTTVNPAAVYDGGVWVNTSGGASTWEPIGDNGITACGDSGGGCGVEQGTYNLEILVVADGPGTDVYAGTINLYKCTITNPASNSPSCSSPFMNLTHVYGCSSISKVHPDQHHLAAVITNSTALMYFANDGGIYRALDGYMGLTTGTCGGSNQFDNLNGTLGSMTQFVSISTHPTDETVIFGGTQDNGSPMTHSGLPSLEWQSVHAGDGGYNAISPVTPTDWFASYPDTGQQTLEIDHCPSGTTCDATQFNAVISSADLAGDDGAFYFPYLLDPHAAQELLLGTCRIWRVDNANSPTGFTALSPDFEPGGAVPCSGNEVNTVRSIAAGGPTDSNGFSKVIYAGTDGYGPTLGSIPTGGRVFVTTDASVPNPVFTEVTGSINPSAYPVSDVAIDDSDTTGQTAYVAIMGFYVGHVFKTTNAGTSWTDFTGALPDAPVNSIVVDSQAGVIYAGTDVGVFATPTAAANWTEVGPAAAANNSGFLPNIPVTALRLFNANGEKLLRASTYGRGVWQYAVTSAPDYSMAITNSPLTVFGSGTSTFTGSLTSFNGYTNGVDASCTAGSTAPPSICNVTGSPITPTTGGAPLSVTVGGSIGDYSFNIQGAGTDSSHIAHDAPAILHVVDFTISSPSPGNPSVSQGNSVNITFAVNALGSFQGTVNLTCGGLPTNASCIFSPASAQPTANAPVNVTLTLSAAATTPTGTNQVVISATVTGAPAPKTQTLNVTFAPFSFAFANTAGPQTVHAGQSASYSLSLTPAQSSALPSGIQFSCSQSDLTAAIAQCSFSPSQIPAGSTGPQTIALTITTSGPAPQTKSRQLSGSPPKASGPPWVALAYLLPITGLLAAGFTKRRRKRSTQSAAFLTLFLVAIELTLISCGSGGGSATGSLVAVTVSPATASVYPTQTQQFIAAVTGSTNTAVNWTATQASIDVNGLYTPPATIATNTAATVTATSQANSSVSEEAAVTILAIAVQITPASTTLYPSQIQQFNATVSGSANTAVTWTLPSGPGTINESGLYTAPPSITSSQRATVKATSQADQTKSQTAQVALAAQSPSGTYTIHVNATSGTLVETTTASLIVQ
jgi:hypothetical protein